MVGGSLTSSASAGAAAIKESEVKKAGESASIRQIMFPPRCFAVRNLFLLAGSSSSQHHDEDVERLNAPFRVRNRQIVANKSLTSAARFKFRQSQSPGLRPRHHQA